MRTTLTDVQNRLPERKTNKQAFRNALHSYLRAQGYEIKEETGSFGSRNLIAGDPDQARFLLTAGRAASAVTALLKIAGTLPENQRSKVCFVFYEPEVMGTMAYAKTHREALTHQLVLQLEEIGTGDQIRIFPTKQLKQDRRKLTSLYKACGYFGSKNVLVQESSVPVWGGIPYAVKICGIQKGKKVSYRNRVRSCPAAGLEETNINILRAGLISFIACTE